MANNVSEFEKQKQQYFVDIAVNLVNEMTVEEKVGLLSGLDTWHTKPVERLDLHSIMMSDGPHGLRKQVDTYDNLGVGESVKAVCFPTASALACSFDTELVHEIGEAIAEECLREDVSVILGPGINMKRNPLCGRNFEYFSEDPLVAGKLGEAYINGVQSRGIGTCLKHFAVNNQEKRRMTVDAIVDDRALNEIYLKAFKYIIENTAPASVMCSYNRLGGEYNSENKALLTDILRDKWGYQGIVVSDWGAVHDRTLGIKTGLDLEMPGNNGYNDKKVLESYKNGDLSQDELDKAAVRVTAFILRCLYNRKAGLKYDEEAHHNLAVKAAENSAVLLKNDDNLLPCSLKKSIAVIGEFARTPRIQGAGSSKINPIKVDAPLNAFLNAGIDVEYSRGYALREDSNTDPDKLINDACVLAAGKDIVYVFAGLPEGFESEGFDRNNMDLPFEQNRLIEEVAKANDNVVVVLIGGAPVTLPWFDHVKSVLLMYLAGEGMGSAAVDLLTGKTVPSGKLAETWPFSEKDNPSYGNFPGNEKYVEYIESIFIGYRYYESAHKDVQFPFGYGLSYSDFEYSDIRVLKDHYHNGEKISLFFTLTNRGRYRAKETSFIFSSHKSEKVFMPEKELRSFVKTELEPGESREIEIILDTEDLGYYNTYIDDWYTPSGKYELIVGPSSGNTKLSLTVSVTNPDNKIEPDLRATAPSYCILSVTGGTFDRDDFGELLEKALPEKFTGYKKPYTPEITLENIKDTLIGKLVIKYAEKTAMKAGEIEPGQEGMILASITEMPLFALVSSGGDDFPEYMMNAILYLANGHPLKAIKELRKNKK